MECSGVDEIPVVFFPDEKVNDSVRNFEKNDVIDTFLLYEPLGQPATAFECSDQNRSADLCEELKAASSSENEQSALFDEVAARGDESLGQTLHTVKSEFEENGEEPDVVDEQSCSPQLLPSNIFRLDDGVDFTESLDFLTDGLDGGEVHDMDALSDAHFSDLGMSPLLDVKNEEQLAGANIGNELFEDRTIVDEEENEGARGKKTASHSRRKLKVDWSPDLHQRFVAAVEQLGVEKATPSRILEMMGVHCLTRHNIASHLQKYRSHRRHLTGREAEAATWQNRRPLDLTYSKMRRDGTCWVPQHAPPHIQPRPSMGLPSLQPHPPPPHPSTLPLPPPSGSVVGMPLHVWGHPSMDHSSSHMWQQPPPPGWYGPDGTLWPFPVPPMDVWGNPHHGTAVPVNPCYQPSVMRHPTYPAVAWGPPQSNYGPHSNHLDSCFDPDAVAQFCAGLPEDLDLPIESDGPFALDTDEAKYILDNAINEALANPSQPLPLGLKPPSMEKVMAELERQGIPTTHATILTPA